jgi:TonB family protein
MRQHVTAADEDREPLKRPVVISMSCHVGLVIVVLVGGFFSPPPFDFGEADGANGGAFKVTPVDGIPLNVPTAPRNPVANDTQSQVPAAPEQQPPAPEPEAPPEEPEAVPIEQPTRRRPPAPAVQKSAPEQKPNEVRSSVGARASSEIFTGTQQETGAGVSLTGSNPFGEGFAWYSAALQRAVGESWRQTLSQASGAAARPATVRFMIMRDGAIQDIRIVESSGNRSVDYTAQRAILGITPFRALPPGLRRSSIVVDIFFQLQ